MRRLIGEPLVHYQDVRPELPDCGQLFKKLAINGYAYVWRSRNIDFSHSLLSFGGFTGFWLASSVTVCSGSTSNILPSPKFKLKTRLLCSSGKRHRRNLFKNVVILLSPAFQTGTHFTAQDSSGGVMNLGCIEEQPHHQFVCAVFGQISSTSGEVNIIHPTLQKERFWNRAPQTLLQTT